MTEAPLGGTPASSIRGCLWWADRMAMVMSINASGHFKGDPCTALRMAELAEGMHTKRGLEGPAPPWPGSGATPLLQGLVFPLAWRRNAS